MCMKSPIRIDLAWRLQPKPSHYERWHMPSNMKQDDDIIPCKLHFKCNVVTLII